VLSPLFTISLLASSSDRTLSSFPLHADFGPNVPVIPIAACPALFEV